MHEINLQYVGKKPLPRELDVPVLKMGKILFSPNAWLPAHAAKKLMEINPSMFIKIGEKNGPEIEDAADIIAKKAEMEKDDFDLASFGSPQEEETPKRKAGRPSKK